MTTPRYTRANLLNNQVYSTLRRPGLAGDLAGDYDIFTVTGVILVYDIFGIITTVVANAAVPFLEFRSVVPAAVVPISAAHASLDTIVAGGTVSWAGTAAGALTSGAVGAADRAAALTWGGNFLVLTAGIIEVDNAVAGTGILDWYITYLPLVAGTTVTVL